MINEAIQEWARVTGRSVTYVMKGQNCRTEMYSAVEAEVEDPEDSSTALNEDLTVEDDEDFAVRAARAEGLFVSQDSKEVRNFNQCLTRYRCLTSATTDFIIVDSSAANRRF